MIAVILSAGAGSRLLPLTREIPKCLVPVDGKTILEWQLEALKAAGMDGVVVVGGYRSRQIAAHLEQHPPSLPVELVFNPFWSVASSIGSVWAARDHLHDPFCVLNGDTIFDPLVIADAVDRAPDGISLLVEPLAGVTQDDMLVAVGTRDVRAVGKQLPREEATHRSLGVVISKGDARRYLAALEAVIGGPAGVQSFHHAIVDHLAREATVHAIIAEGSWQEVDGPEDIARWTGRLQGSAA